MKSTIALLCLALSVNVFALESLRLSLAMTTTPTLFPATTSEVVKKVQAEAIVNDTQAMLQTGKVSVFLSQNIQDLQAQNKGLSETEALDVLIEAAQMILSK